MHVLIRYKYFLVLWTFKCFIFNLLHPLVFSNIMTVILLVVYIILYNIYNILCFKSVNSATEHWPQWILALYKCIILYSHLHVSHTSKAQKNPNKNACIKGNINDAIQGALYTCHHY